MPHDGECHPVVRCLLCEEVVEGADGVSQHVCRPLSEIRRLKAARDQAQGWLDRFQGTCADLELRLLATQRELAEARADLTEARRVLAYLWDDGWISDIHLDGCPEDGYCACPIPRDIDRVLGTSSKSKDNSCKEPPA